jgi:hypothetical protein
MGRRAYGALREHTGHVTCFCPLHYDHDTILAQEVDSTIDRHESRLQHTVTRRESSALARGMAVPMAEAKSPLRLCDQDVTSGGPHPLFFASYRTATSPDLKTGL